jgi:hypothetical protein
MKYRIATISTLILTGCAIDFGLIGVFVDSAYRGNSSTIQSISFYLAFIFPLFLVLGFYKKLTRMVASVAILIAAFCMIYHIYVYGPKMINGNVMTIVTIGFFVTILLLCWLLIKKKKTKPDRAFE